MTRTTLDTCHVVIVHSCSITCIHVSCFLQSLSTQFFFYMFVPCIFVYFNSTCHVSFVSLHVCAMFLTIIPAANADFLPNFFKINCHIGIDAIEETLSKKKREKLNQSSLLNKNMYQSSVIHLHHFFLYLHISRFVKFKVRHEMSSV